MTALRVVLGVVTAVTSLVAILMLLSWDQETGQLRSFRRLFWLIVEFFLSLRHVVERVPGGGVRCVRCGEAARTEHDLLGGDDSLSWDWKQGKRR